MTDETLPRYVVRGEFDDAAWRAVAAGQVRHDDAARVIAQGPREHPYDPSIAHVIEVENGPTLIFPGEPAARDWLAEQGKAPKAKA
ncbi:hypothetical protein [Salinarimonas soli]|uniref:Uncharacterized protein n=1 Tax=Salinarimonas soli TaxID=1638099 RepID=A0A5B2VH56_9HYPH|nr:hypothetical protein [Salinarimonas soli]KAA2237682.1 hypothetical protein F0L46_08355 [Salinarimonas soli]